MTNRYQNCSRIRLSYQNQNSLLSHSPRYQTRGPVMMIGYGNDSSNNTLFIRTNLTLQKRCCLTPDQQWDVEQQRRNSWCNDVALERAVQYRLQTLVWALAWTPLSSTAVDVGLCLPRDDSLLTAAILSDNVLFKWKITK